MTDAERTQLGSSYPVGKVLWRVPVAHFSTWDFNYGFRPPADAQPGAPGANINDNPDKPCEVPGGSTIECETQVLREGVPVVGTPYRLEYRSDRTRGRKDRYSLKIPVTPHTLPGPLVQADVSITLAGRTFKQSFAALADQVMNFTWDGYDAFGRLLQGTQFATVTVDNVYNAVYSDTSSFGTASGTAAAVGPTRLPVSLGGSKIYPIGNWDAEGMGLGGWDLDVHHVYDPVAKAIQLGSGAPPPSSRFLSNIIQTVAGNGVQGNSPDGTLASLANIDSPRDVAVGPDGLLYFSQRYCIRRVTAAGALQTVTGNCSGDAGDGAPDTTIQPDFLAFGPAGELYFSSRADDRVRKLDPITLAMTTVAGTSFGFSGDGGPAVSAQLESPQELAVAPDGSLYIADELNSRIRKVGTDGIIRTVAGGGNAAPTVEGPATEARFDGVVGVAVGSDGTLYISEAFTHRVLRVGVDGIIHLFAGTGQSNPRGDGGPATMADLEGATDLAVGPDRTVYILAADTVRQVDPNGIISTVAGIPGTFVSLGEGGPANAASLRTNYSPGITVGPEGTLYIAERDIHRVRRVGGALPGVSTSDLVIPSRDGRELYVFNFAGKHLRTLDAFIASAPPLYQFAYDSSTGFLATVTDVDGNVTTVLRDGSGNVNGLRGPFGQQTAIGLGSDGYIASISNPASETTSFTYYPGGLMKTKTSPRSFVSSYSYDPLGRLTQDQDPPEAGGVQSLARTDTANGWTIDRSTRLSRTTHYDISQPPSSSDRTRTITLPDGHVAIVTDRLDGTHTTTLPDGTVITTTDGPDPRFGMGAPISSTKIQTPAGLSRTETISLAATLSDATNLLSLTSASETRVLNGRSYQMTFDASTLKWTTTSPVGRKTFVTLDSHARLSSSQIDTLLADGFEYDSRGRLFKITSGTRVTQLGYDPSSGFLNSVTDPLSQTSQLLPDAIGRTSRITYPDTNFALLGYDADGNLGSVTPPGQPQHLQTYSAVGLLATYQPPVAGSTGTTQTTYGYDFDRALGDVTRPDGLIVHHAYDTAGRLQTITLPTGTITRTYNSTTGKVDTIAGPAGETIAFGYDGLLQTTMTLTGPVAGGPVAGTVTLTYDNDFRVASKAVNTNPAVSFGYDADSLLTAAGSLTLTPDLTTGLLSSTTLGAVSDSFGYDSFGALASYTARFNSAALYSENITLRDALGRIKTKTETVQGTTHSYDYTYDTRGRLTDVKVDGVLTAHYAFASPAGANGNRTSKTAGSTTTNATYDAQDRLLTYGTATYTYGANGELKTKTVGGQTTTYTYDVLGNLLSVALPGGPNVDYIVDGLGRRVGKKVNGALAKGLLYENQLRAVAELDGSNNVVSTFVYGTKINVPEYMVRGSDTYRFVLDHLGSVRLVVKTSDGSIAQRIDYDEFGSVTSDTNPGFQLFGFAGGLYDPDTKLVRFGARDYDPTSGRWTAKDPIRFAAGQTNLYVYVGNDPVDWTDPSGQYVWIVGVALAGGGYDLAMQLYGNGGRIGCVDWAEVGAWTLGGAAVGVLPEFMVGTAFSGISASGGLVTVTQWGSGATPWVMLGDATFRNYVMSGVWQLGYQFESAATWVVSEAQLRYPSGVEWSKGLLGQRILGP